MGRPRTERPRNWVPAALVANLPVLESRLVVLTDLMVVADTRPPSRDKPSVVAELAAADPVAVDSDPALVATVPLVRIPGTPTEATEFVWVMPICDVQPSVDRADLPDCTVEATLTSVPNAPPAKDISPAAADACVAAAAVDAPPSAPASITTAPISEYVRVRPNIVLPILRSGDLADASPDVA
jgi:hypothetical protein